MHDTNAYLSLELMNVTAGIEECITPNVILRVELMNVETGIHNKYLSKVGIDECQGWN